MHTQHLEFLEWARGYDDGRAPIRSLDLHERWMRRLTCPIVRLDSQRSPAELVADVLARARDGARLAGAFHAITESERSAGS